MSAHPSVSGFRRPQTAPPAFPAAVRTRHQFRRGPARAGRRRALIVAAATLAAPTLAASALAAIGVAGAGENAGLGPLSGTHGLAGTTPAPVVAPPPAKPAREEFSVKPKRRPAGHGSKGDRVPAQAKTVPTTHRSPAPPRPPASGLNGGGRDLMPPYPSYDPSGPGSTTPSGNGVSSGGGDLDSGAASGSGDSNGGSYGGD
jgi:hypothetical protein